MAAVIGTHIHEERKHFATFVGYSVGEQQSSHPLQGYLNLVNSAAAATAIDADNLRVDRDVFTLEDYGWVPFRQQPIKTVELAGASYRAVRKAVDELTRKTSVLGIPLPPPYLILARGTKSYFGHGRGSDFFAEAPVEGSPEKHIEHLSLSGNEVNKRPVADLLEALESDHLIARTTISDSSFNGCAHHPIERTRIGPGVNVRWVHELYE